jgi:hypothetical protein
MNWTERYGKDNPPDFDGIAAFIGNPLWGNLCTYLESAYGVLPRVEFSTCSGAPGWNVKYKKSGRALCTLYPAAGSFIALVTIGKTESTEAELLLGGFSPYVQELYAHAKPLNGARWLMIHVTSEEILQDVKRLIALRVPVKG